MDSALLAHLLQLAAKTGDRLIVVDPTTQQPFVLMGLPQYEALVAPAPTVALFAPTPVAREEAPIVEPIDDLPEAVAEAMGNAMSMASGFPSGFSSEPPHAVPPEEERFYVEPLE